MGDGVSDDFKHFLELEIGEFPINSTMTSQMHPGMSFEEAKRRFKDEQKAKKRRKVPKLH